MKYLVRLKPLNPYFFGSNKTFSDTNLHSIQSTLLPQQTHILGMIRKVILEEKGILKLRKKGWWVGSGNFKTAFSLVGGNDNKDSEQKEESLGKIKSISPVFLISLDNKEIKNFHFISPKDIFFDKDQYNLLKVQNLELDDVIYSGKEKIKKNIYFSNINPKIGIENYFTTNSFWKKYTVKQDDISKFDSKGNDIFNFESDIITIESIFQEVFQVGIKREYETKTVQENEEGSFYKKKSYKFINYKNCSFEFAFILDFDNDMFQNGLKRQVFLGAERSVFQLEISKYDDKIDKFYPKSNTTSFSKAIVLGDIYNLEKVKDSYFILNNEYIPFSRIQNSKDSKFEKTKQRNLLPKGTILYLDKDKQLSFEENFYTKIGFNQVIYI